MGIRLTPAGLLRWESSRDEIAPTGSQSLQSAFETDWCEALFTLAADKIPTQGHAEYALLAAVRGALSHRVVPCSGGTLSASRSSPCPPPIALTGFLTAPPMQGGEYLCEEILQRIWERLDGWVRESVASAGGLTAFLRDRARKWHQVGRVCFHLAENRNDEARPFAFMATYGSGFGAAGRLKHLPLRKALEQYAGAKNRAALIKLLAPVQQAAETCDWVKDLVGLRRCLSAHGLVAGAGLSIAAQRAGTRGERAVRAAAELVAPAAPTPGVGDGRHSVAVEVRPRRDAGLQRRGRPWAMTPCRPKSWNRCSTARTTWCCSRANGSSWTATSCVKPSSTGTRCNGGPEGGEISFIEGMRLLAGAPADLRQEERADDERHWVRVAPGDAMREILAGLRQPGALDAVEIADALHGTLRPYQHEGLSWLRFLTRLGLGACPRRRHGAREDHSGAGATAG